MPTFIAISCLLALSLTLATRRRSKNPVPVATALISYGVALFLDVWYALRLPLPHIGVWISNFSEPMADMLYRYLQ